MSSLPGQGIVIPSMTWNMLNQHGTVEPIPRGLDMAWHRLAGGLGRIVPRSYRFLCRARQIVALEKQYSQVTDAKLREAATRLRVVFRCHRDTSTDLDHAFALVREVAYRKIGERPFPVQVAGALALYHGCVAEMATGEGKTLTATLPVTVEGWRGKGCHVITVNDYLAQRDAEWMRHIYEFCGLRVGYVQQGMPHAQRRQGYNADITYGTNKEICADFLRDRLMLAGLRGLGAILIRQLVTGQRLTDRLVQRGLGYAVIDEADSVLVDEAVTPLIISGDAPNPEESNSFVQACQLATSLHEGIHYRLHPQYREIELTVSGREAIARACHAWDGIWKGVRRRDELVTQALTARHLYHREKQYVIEDGKIVIVDEFTGRLMPDRTWREGLHQAIEAKEGLTVNLPKETLARISFQRFFRLYPKLAGMTGTATEARNELWQIYGLPVVVIPTNKPCQRIVFPTQVYSSEAHKWEAVVQAIVQVHEQERPVLVGTRSIQASEHLSRLLEARRLGHQVLNAVYHRQEAQIVACAGQPDHITVATNMAGRGTDIKLGRGVAQRGGLHVIASELNDSSRIDRQLFGRGARQGDPGSAQAIVSLEDELLQRHSRRLASFLRKRWKSSRQGSASLVMQSLFQMAHRRSERMAFQQRKGVMEADHWLDEQLGFAGTE